MEYCADWEKTKSRFEALWQGEIIDRCCAAVLAPTKDTSKLRRIPSDPEELIKYRTDGEWVLKRNLEIFENTYFAGDAIPIIYPDMGAACHAGFFSGAKYHFESTVWYFPSIEEWSPDSLQFDPESFIYRKTLELTRYLSNESNGRYFIAMPEVCGNLDALAHLRGSENVLMDILIDPKPVLEALKELQKTWKETTDLIYDIVRDTNDGGSCVGWLYTWAPGLHNQMQSDISVMLSPESFKGFVLPELVEQSNHLQYPLYHIDGHEQTRYLDMICSIENLKMIQWTNVAGEPALVNFIPTFQKIQEAGKGLLLHANIKDIETLMENLSSKGLYLVVNARDREEADYAMKKIAQLTHE